MVIFNKNKKKVLLKGYFGKNLGDDLFLKMITDRYPKTDFEMYSRFNYNKILNNRNTKCYTIVSVYGLFKIMRKIFPNFSFRLEHIKNYDLIVEIGGSLFIEPSNFDYEIYRQQRLGEGIPDYILGANFGPYHSSAFFNFYKDEFFPKVSDICFRDNYSFDLLADKNIRKASDIIFGLSTKELNIKNRRRVIISVIDCNRDSLKFDRETYYRKIEECINFFQEKKYEVLLMSFSKIEGDETVIRDIIKRNPDKNIEKYFYRGDLNEALSILADSQIIVGERFHANILGMLMNKTVIPVAYSDKTLNVLRDMNFKGKYFDLRNLEHFDITNLTEDDLNYKIDVSEQILDSENHFRELDKSLDSDV